MISLNKQTDYGVQLLLALQELPQGEVLSLRLFSQNQNISFLFLQQIARKLKQAGLIAASKGAQGGYFLAKQGSEIRLTDIINAIDGEYAIVECMKKESDCPKESTCTSKPLFTVLQTNMLQSMNAYSLVDMKALQKTL